MNQLQASVIVLARTDYGEADRIITLLTPDQGKLRLMARGVRKAKSKNAGGIELFSTSSITYLKGRGELGTLISSRLDKHYGNIVKNIDRTMLGYDLIKLMHKATEDGPEPHYYELLEAAFSALDTLVVDIGLIRIWFQAHLVRFAGHMPNLITDTSGNALDAEAIYNFDFDSMACMLNDRGRLHSGDIKVLRLLFGNNSPAILQQVTGVIDVLPTVAPIISNLFQPVVMMEGHH
jgi:DNA repair protein RecO (recombination protein O)